MHYLNQFFAWIFEPSPVAAQRRAEAYLAQATDMCDLERRIRQLDKDRDFGPFATGL
ncbi:MAG TPA: DUF3563 family protein [Burkholderiaceae bacterium]|nr:DUF3563 family protein [Burkholderiaceae bacterium]